MFSEQRIRGFLFYLCVIVFFMGLPPILSSTLGYKFNWRTLKFTKAGLIVLKTQPQGASIYLEQKLLPMKTPATINELLPGKYHLRFELESYYPWSSDVEVKAGKVTRLEKTILFPLRPDIKQLNKDKLSSFLIDEERETVYYINPENDIIYKTDLEGEHFQEIAGFLKISPPPTQWKLSPDRDKLLYFNINQIGIVNLTLDNQTSSLDSAFILNYPNGKIIDIFWHSDNYHLILIGNKNIEALEARPNCQPVILVTLNKRNSYAYYDIHTETLYFLDSQRAADGNLYDNLYKLELATPTLLRQELRKLKPNE